MGRRRGGEDDFTRWRSSWRRRLVAEHDERFAAEVMVALDDDVEAFGVGGAEVRSLREAILPALVCNVRRGSARVTD